MDIKIESNIKEAFESAVRKRCKKIGIKLSDKTNVIIQYFQYLGKLIPDRARKVYYSKEFTLENIKEAHRKGFKNLVKTIKEGGDLSPFQSKMYINPYKVDNMKAYWDIHHFHIGPEKEEESRFIKRSGPLVYAVTREDAVYMIATLPHGEWSNLKLLEVLNSNWPQLFPNLNFKTPLSAPSTEEEVKAFRKGSINTLHYQVGDKIITAPSFNTGVTSNGLPAQAVLNHLRCIHLLKAIEEEEKENIIEEVKKVGKLIDKYAPELNSTLKYEIELCYLFKVENIGSNISFDYTSKWRIKHQDNWNYVSLTNHYIADF